MVSYFLSVPAHRRRGRTYRYRAAYPVTLTERSGLVFQGTSRYFPSVPRQPLPSFRSDGSHPPFHPLSIHPHPHRPRYSRRCRFALRVPLIRQRMLKLCAYSYATAVASLTLAAPCGATALPAGLPGASRSIVVISKSVLRPTWAPCTTAEQKSEVGDATRTWTSLCPTCRRARRRHS